MVNTIIIIDIIVMADILVSIILITAKRKRNQKIMTKIDFHAHILPKCDHGSDSRKTSIEQLKQAKKADIGVVCATSHFYAQRENVDRFIKRRTISYTKLKYLLLQGLIVCLIWSNCVWKAPIYC